MKKLKKMFALALILCMALTGIMPVYADKMTVQEAVLTESTDQPDPGIYFEYDPYMNELVQTEVIDYYTLVDSSYTELTLNSGKWYVIVGEVTLQSRVENKSQLSDPANIILANGCILNAPYGIENGSRNSLRIFGQDKNGGTGQLIINNTPESWAGIGGGYSPGMDEQGCGYVEINGGILEIHGGMNAAGIGGANNGGDVSVTINAGTVKAYGGMNAAGIGGGNNGVNVSVTVNSGKVTAYGGNNGAGIGTGYGSTADKTGNGKITVNGGTVEAFGGEWAAGIGRGYHGYPNKVEINGGNVTAKGGARGGAGIGGGKDTGGVDTKINGGTVCAFGNVDTSNDLIACGIGRGGKGSNNKSLTITGERISVISGTSDTNATVTTADTYIRLRESYVLISVSKDPVYTVTWMLDDSTVIDTTDVTEGKMPVHSDPAKDGCIFIGWTPALAPVTGNVTYTARFYELTHEHTFSEGWSFDETHHWCESTCGHSGLTSGFGEHTFGDGVVDGSKTVYTCSVCGYKKYVYNAAGDNEGEIVSGISYTGISLTLSSDISINFYVNLTDDAKQNGKMTFDIGGRTVTGISAKYNETEEEYYFSAPLTVLEMAETVTATFNYNGVDYIQKYSVADYIDTVVGNPGKYGTEAAALARKIANYGYYAQIYLASIHDNVTIGKDGYEEMFKFGEFDIDAAKAKEVLAKHTIRVSGTSGNLSLYGTTVYFDSATALNYYVTVKDGAKPTASAINTVTGKERTLKSSSTRITSISFRSRTSLPPSLPIP